MPGRKINFWLKSAIKISPATIANAYNRSLKSLHRLFGKHLDHNLEKFQLNRMVQNMQNFELLDKKNIKKLANLL